MLPMKVLSTRRISIGHDRIVDRTAGDGCSPDSPPGSEYAIAHS